MRIALIADIHSNLIALESILRDIRQESPDMILSLGDQVNLGPAPKETLELLHAHNAVCLHGNHERYILSAMEGDPGYDGANFDSLRFNARQLTREEITFPMTLELEGVTFCHAMPNDDRFPVFDEQRAIPLLKEMTFDRPMHIICGHGHNPTHIALPHLTLDSIGSAGCMDHGVPGTAPYAMLNIQNGETFLRPYYVAYSTAALKPLYKRSGMADFCPTMARIACLQMMHNHDYLVTFVSQALALSKSRAERVITSKTWTDMDETFDWPDGMSTAEFWRT